MVDVTVKLTIGGCPLRAEIKREIETRVGVHPGVAGVHIEWGEMTADERSEVMTKARWNARQQRRRHRRCRRRPACWPSPAARAASARARSPSTSPSALARRGRTVGVLDADIWGFSVPRLLGIDDRMEAQRDRGPRPSR